MDMHTDIHKAIDIGRLFPGTVIMVVMISHRFQMAAGILREKRYLANLAKLQVIPECVGQLSAQRQNQRVDCGYFVLVAAMNPCPCGHYGDPERQCTCASGMIQRYRVVA
ncbi:MAG: ATP-binding protein [Anaerolineae bacterium]